jgi:(p)ppGpp synthase/HD superfamily hydrolase
VRDFEHASPLVRSAYRYATAAHAGQVKDSDGSPYIDHLVAVAQLVDDAGYDDQVVAAALLHDVIEHADGSVADIRAEFGDGVADLVEAMTEPEGIESWERRKRAHRERIAHGGNARAQALFAADKAANAAALRRAIKRGNRVERMDGKVDHYTATLKMLDGDPVSTRLREELDRLAAERRQPSANRSQLRSPS